MLFSSHTRSFCLSFLLLSVLLTSVNFVKITTSINKLIVDEQSTDQNSTIGSSPLPLLWLNLEDVYHNRFNCYGRIRHQKPERKKTNDSDSRSPVIPVILHQPNRTSVENSQIPYNYDQWRSAPVMPRLVTKCEHNLMMQLLTRFDKLAKKYSLEYMMIDGTLLGSWRHHDLIPWDDDIDLMMSVQLKHRLNAAIEYESRSSRFYVDFHHRWDSPKEFEYYKFYFSTSPRFSEHPWRYPFVDLIFYHENETHLWQESMQQFSSVPKQSIFPLSLRPLGPLWLPAPKSPPDYFMSVNWTTYDSECLNGPWSHKYERVKQSEHSNEFISTIDCQDLFEYYPFVERSSAGEEERLVVNGTTTHIVRTIDNRR